MKIYKDIIQSTDEWKELRYRKIGGSTNSKVMANSGKSVEENAIFATLLGDFMEEFEIEDNYATAEMQRGNDLEPIAADEFSRIYGKKCYEIGWAEISDFVGISPDRLIEGEKITEALEIKCPSKNIYSKYLLNNNEAITDYCWQLVHYFHVFEDLEKLNFFIYRPENLIQNHILIELTRDTVIQVNKNKSAAISELVEASEVRIEELRIALKNKIEALNTINF